MAEGPRGVKLEARLVPFPGSISGEARAALERLVRDDGIPLNSLYVMPAPDDHAGWKRLQTMVAVQYDAAAQAYSGRARSSVTTITIDSATVHVAVPEEPAGTRVYIDLHGGALTVGGGDACRVGAQQQADRHSALCYGIDYRMPPGHPYPAALDDCIATYRYALDRHGAENIIVGGRSAGGNLAAAMLLRARDEGLPRPAALMLLSPEVDLTESGDSFEVNRLLDVVLPGSLMPNNLLYAGGADLANPYLSPLFGELAGFPSTFIQSGTRDLFLSNAVRFHRRLRQAGVAADLHVFEAMPHGGFMGGTPEDEELAAEVSRFCNAHWPVTGARSSPDGE